MAIEPRAGLIFAADVIEFGLRSVATFTESHSFSFSATWDHNATLETGRVTSVNFVLNDITIDMTGGNAGGLVTVSCPYLSATPWTDASADDDLSATVTFDDFRVYVMGADPGAATITPNTFYVTWSGAEVIINGISKHTSGAGSVSGNGLAPGYCPLLGLPVRIYGTCSAGTASGAVAPPTYTSESEVTSVVTGGWRWKPVGSASWSDLPVALFTYPAMPGTGSLNVSGIVVSDSTYGTHLNLRTFASRERSAPGTCPGSPGGPAAFDGGDEYGEVWLCPNLARSFERMESADFAALIYRGGLPGVDWEATRSRKIVGATLPTNSSSTGVVYNSFDETYFTATSGQHQAETDAFPTTVYSPVVVARSAGSGTTPLADGCDDEGFPADLQDLESVGFETAETVEDLTANPDLLATLHHNTVKHVRYFNYWGNPHWSFGFPQINWELNGSPIDWLDYWGPIRTQWLDLAGLPTGEKRQTRNRLIGTNVLDDGELAPWQDATNGGLRWVGASRWQTLDVTPQASYTYNSGTISQFTPDGGTVGHHMGRLRLTPTATTMEAVLDLGLFTHQPFQWPHIATHVTLDWQTTNVLSVSLYIEGQDGTRVLLASDGDLKGIRLAIPRGDTTEYAGSWALDHGAGVATDVGADVPAGGISTATVADPERVTAFSLLPGATRRRLVIEATATGTGLAMTIDYPILEHDPPQEPTVVYETPQHASFIWPKVAGEGGNGLRFGNLDYYNQVSGWNIPPVVTALGESAVANHPTAVDALAWYRHWLEGNVETNNLNSEINSLFDAVELGGRSEVPGADLSTYGFLLPDHTTSSYRFAILNHPAEVPPLGNLPRGTRDAAWDESSSLAQVAYVWAQEPARYVTPGPVGVRLYEPSPSTTEWTTVEGGSPTGWTITRHSHIVDNSESNDYRIFYDGTHYADATPWHGHFAVFGLPDTAGTNVSYDVARGGEHYRAFVAGSTAWFSTSANALGWTDADTGLAAEWVSVRVARGRRSRDVYLTVADSGAIKDRITTDQGATFSVATTISAGSDNNYPAQVIGTDNNRFIYWVKGTGPYAVYGRIEDGSGAALATAFAVTGVGAVDDAGISVAESFVAGVRRVVLQVIQSGAVVYYTSTDGRTFS